MGVIIQQAGRSLIKDRTDATERILAFLALSEDITGEWMRTVLDADGEADIWNAQSVPLHHFNGVQPFAYESLMFLTQTYDRAFIPPEDEGLREAQFPWDFSTLMYEDVGREKAERIGKTYAYSLSRIRTVPMKVLRGLSVPLLTGKLCEVSYAFLFTDGTYATQRLYLELQRGLWVAVAVPGARIYPTTGDEAMQNQIWMHKSLSLTTEYDWTVRVGYSLAQLPSIALPTDPVGSRDMFKFRDIAAGKTRRDALRHWVSGHWRTRGVPPDQEETEILPFLRGQQDFKWNGLECRIIPSAYDIRRCEKYERMRATRGKA